MQAAAIKWQTGQRQRQRYRMQMNTTIHMRDHNVFVLERVSRITPPLEATPEIRREKTTTMNARKKKKKNARHQKHAHTEDIRYK